MNHQTKKAKNGKNRSSEVSSPYMVTHFYIFFTVTLKKIFSFFINSPSKILSENYLKILNDAR